MVCVIRWWVGRVNAILTELIQATQTAQKRADSHHHGPDALWGSGARCVGRHERKTRELMEARSDI